MTCFVARRKEKECDRPFPGQIAAEFNRSVQKLGIIQIMNITFSAYTISLFILKICLLVGGELLFFNVYSARECVAL